MTDTFFQVKNGLIVNASVFVVDPGQNAAIVASTLFIGNGSVNSSINSTFYTGVANQALTIFGIGTLVTQTELAANLVNYELQANLETDVQTIQALQLQVLTPNNGGVTPWLVQNVTTTMASITLTANTTMGAPSNFANGTYLLFVQQANGGSHKITWPATNYFWPAGVAPTLTTANGALDIVSFIYNSGVNTSVVFGSYAPNFLG